MPLCPTCRTQCEDGLPICPVDGTPLPLHDMTGRVLGDRYRVLERIGEGGMGTVYLCQHVTLGRKMAVKLLRPEFCADEELVRRFQQEAQAASQIGQENIIDVLDFGRTPDGSLYFVMEALEGQSLAALLRCAGRLPPRRALLILNQICRALGAAHVRGIVHRDLKPDNVFVLRREDGSDFVKVLDFGISMRGAAPKDGRITRAGAIIGTPEYMAPEQAAATTVDHRCDIYAFGVVAYEMLTGKLPFRGETALATLMKHQSESPEPPTRHNPDLPPEVEQLILRALVKRPQGRHQSMGEVATDLVRGLKAVGLDPVNTPTPEGSLASLSPVTARFRMVPPSPVPRRQSQRGETLALAPDEDLRLAHPHSRWRWPAAIAASSLLFGTALGMAWRWRPHAPAGLAPPSPPPVAKAAEPSAPPPPAPPVPSPSALPPASPPAPEAEPLAEIVAVARVAPPPARKSATKHPSAKPAKPAAARDRRRATGLVSAPKAAPVPTRRAPPAPDRESPYGKVEDLKPDPFQEPPATPSKEPLSVKGDR